MEHLSGFGSMDLVYMHDQGLSRREMGLDIVLRYRDLCTTPLIVIPAKAGIQEVLDNTGYRLSATSPDGSLEFYTAE
jgi:hypothetical protein